MFISVLDLFKIGIGPSSSHTIGPMVAANDFIAQVENSLSKYVDHSLHIRCELRGSLAFTGKGHGTDKAVALGLHNYTAKTLANMDVDALVKDIWQKNKISLRNNQTVKFLPEEYILFDKGDALPEHPNGMIFELIDDLNKVVLSETYFSIGGGFINTLDEIHHLVAPLKMQKPECPFPFDSANLMLGMTIDNDMSIADIKRVNELENTTLELLEQGLDDIWTAMQICVESGLAIEGELPGGLNLPRRAKNLFEQLKLKPEEVTVNDWLCAYAMAVNEENAAGHMVVTAPTNGAAGVIPAVLYYFIHHEKGTKQQVRDFLLTASAIGGIIKHRSSISGAEVGCQGEVGASASMAAAGLCAIRGGTPQQVENAAEIALEHHLGMTCDPIKGLVQIPCIERNGFGAIKAYAAASLAIKGSGRHFVSLDSCIAAMRQTGVEMSEKYKETSLGGLAVSITEC
jgi:L-serine dehydratase